MKRLLLFLYGACLALALSAQADSSRYPAHQKYIGFHELDARWEPVLQPNQPPFTLLRVGGRMGYYLADGWVSGAGLAQVIHHPDYQRTNTQRWTIVSVFSRYYLLHRKRWSPFAELALAYAVSQHLDPNDVSGAGPLAFPQFGLAFRLNATWSADVGWRYPLHTPNGDNRYVLGSRLKLGLWLHW